MPDKLVLTDLDVKGKKILMRVDFNVPLDKEGSISDDMRIQAALPSINHVLKHGGALILMSHLGRPKGRVVQGLSLEPCAERLHQLLGMPVSLAPDCVGEDVSLLARKLKPGEVLLLENLRFHAAEEHPEGDLSFAKQLASLADYYVNDAFGTAHRSHSSTTEVPKSFPGKAAMGLLMRDEEDYLNRIVKNPPKPFYAILGGAKISTKIGVIKSLLNKVDSLLIGGGMAYTFLRAQGCKIGNSICEEDLETVAREILEEGKRKNVNIYLPQDVVISNRLGQNPPVQIVDVKDGIPRYFEGLDIGPKTIQLFKEVIDDAAMIFWNGPLGVFEIPEFAKGTNALAKSIARLHATTIVGGGDSLSAIRKSGLANQMSHLSTGGGASLVYIEKESLPGIEALSDRGVKAKF